MLAALVGAAMFYLANFVEPQHAQMTIRIPSSRLDADAARPDAGPDAAGHRGARTTETGTVAQ